jgi:hypothetical protein
MITDNEVQRLLRGAALSMMLLLAVAPAALADPADLGLNPSTADYAAYVKTFDRDAHPNKAAMANEALRCAQCAADLSATLWNERNLAAR